MKRRLVLLSLIFTIVLSFCMPAAYATVVGGPGCTWQPQPDGGMRVLSGNIYISDGWFEWQGHSYLFSSEGYMLTGWQSRDGFWYYLAQEATDQYPYGACYKNCITPDGHAVNESGALTEAIMPPMGNPYGYTCVDVNLTAQVVTVYQGNIPVIVTPCVTGRATQARATSPGKFTIYAKETDRYLQGLNEDGTKYKSWVNYWMPFNGGQGLHDASWRSNFGGTIYVYSGSHGCVNLPPTAAAQLFNIAYVGMPVIVHN